MALYSSLINYCKNTKDHLVSIVNVFYFLFSSLVVLLHVSGSCGAHYFPMVPFMRTFDLVAARSCHPYRHDRPHSRSLKKTPPLPYHRHPERLLSVVILPILGYAAYLSMSAVLTQSLHRTPGSFRMGTRRQG
jgi:hypothetical protein